MKRVVIVADSSFAAQMIGLELRQASGLKIVEHVDGRAPIGEVLARHDPDIVVVDDDASSDDAIERLADVAAAVPTATCVLLTLDMHDARAEQAFAAGADTVISKSLHPVSVGALLRETANGNVLHRPRPRVRPPVDRGRCPLTDRELEILSLAAEGHTNGQIARQLWVTEQTIKFHLSNTYRKLGVANRTEASRYAFLNSLVDPVEQLAMSGSS